MNIKITNSQYNRLNEGLSNKTINKIVDDLFKKYYVIRSISSNCIYDRITNKYIQFNDIIDYIEDRVGSNWNDINPIYNKFLIKALKEQAHRLNEGISDKTIDKLVDDLMDMYYFVGSQHDYAIYNKATNKIVNSGFNKIIDYLDERIGASNVSFDIFYKFKEKSLKEYKNKLTESVSEDSENKIINNLLKKYCIGKYSSMIFVLDKETNKEVKNYTVREYIADRIGATDTEDEKVNKIFYKFIRRLEKNYENKKLTEEISDKNILKIAYKLLDRYSFIPDGHPLQNVRLYKDKKTNDTIDGSIIINYLEDMIGWDPIKIGEIYSKFIDMSKKNYYDNLNGLNEQKSNDKYYKTKKYLIKLVNKYFQMNNGEYNTITVIIPFDNYLYGYRINPYNVIDHIAELTGYSVKDVAHYILGYLHNPSDSINEEISDKTINAVVKKLLKTYYYKDGSLKFKDTDTTLDPVDALDLANNIKDMIGNHKEDFTKVVDKFHGAYHKEAKDKLTEQISDKSIEKFINHMVNKWDYMGYKDTNFYFKDKNGTLWDPYFIQKYIEDRMTEKRSEITDIYKRFAYKITEKYGLKSLFDKEFDNKINESVSDNTIDKITNKIIKKFYSPSSKLDGTERLKAIHNFVENIFGRDYDEYMDKIYHNMSQKIKPY